MTIRSTQSPPRRTVQQLVFLFLLTSPTSALLIGSAAIESKWTAAITMEMALPHVEASIARILWLERGGVVPNTKERKERKEENKQNNDDIITNGETTTKTTTTTMDDCGSTSCCSENDASWLIPLALECDQHIFDEHLTHNAYVGEDDKEELDHDDVVVIGNPSWQSLQVLGSRIGHHHHHHRRNGKENDDLYNNNNDDDDKSLALVAAWTLLALGGLESAIRTQMSYPTGQAPLLSTMISQLQQQQQHNNNHNNTWNGKQNQYHHHHDDNDEDNDDNNDDDKLIPILQSLLLPNNKTGGLNLKNLLWHGFCGSLPRPWLALVISLTRQVQQQQQSSSSSQQQQTLSNNDNNNNQSRPPLTTTTTTTTTTDPKRHKDDNPSMSQEESQWEYMESFQKEIALGETLRQQQQQDNNLSSSSSSSSTTATLLLQRISMWLPSSHLSMLELAISWMDHYPACTSALLIVMLEHGLRLEWCHVNHQFIDAMAQPGRYYVTLDGHGQRHQHDLLLHPYRQQQQSQEEEEVQQQQELNNSPGSCSNVQKDHDDDDVDEDNKKKKKTIKNSLVNHLGPNVMSFLADLFCSAAGPNIRATLGHGLWDSFIQRELELMAAASTTMTTTTTRTTDYDSHSTPCPNATTTNNVSLPQQPKQPDHCRFLQPVVSLLVLALYETATAALSSSGKLSSSSSLSFFHYAPKFSFAAMTYQSLGSIRQELRQLQEILERYHCCCCCYQTGPSSSETRYGNSNQPSDCSDSIVERRLSCPSLEQVEHLCEQLMKTLEWNKLSQQQQQDCNDQIYAAMEHELEMNQKLASMGAIRTLLDDIAQACQLFNTHAQDALQLILAQQQQQQEVNDDDISYCSLHETTTTKEDENVYSYSRRRQIKKANRILSLATPLAWTLYKFTAHVAMVALLETLQQQSSTDNDKTTNDMTMIIFLKAVERTRMVVSTTSTFFIVNMDRAIKAMNEYSKSKAIQKFRQVCCSYYSDEQNI